MGRTGQQKDFNRVRDTSMNQGIMGDVMDMNRHTYRHSVGFKDAIELRSSGKKLGLSSHKNYDRKWDRSLQHHVDRSNHAAYALNEQENANSDQIKLFNSKKRVVSKNDSIRDLI